MLSQITKLLDDVDRADLEARVLLRQWGWAPEKVLYVKPAPCEREHCGGSHVVGFTGCMLCGR